MTNPGTVAAAGLLAAYLFTRLFNLGALPMVSDEGTYITWGVRALYATAFQDWLASLEDGKQPLLAWLMPPFLALIDDRLIAGRLVSVLTGLANLVLVTLATRRLFGRMAGRVAAVLYVVAPIALIHDRMALYDSLVATTALLTLLAALEWSDRPALRQTLVLGAAMAAAVLTKLSALFFVLLVPVVVALQRPAALRYWWRLAQAYFIAGAAYSLLYLSPIVDNLPEGTFQRYSLTLDEVLKLPFDVWLSNLHFIRLAAVAYLGWPVTVACLAGLAWITVSGGRGGRVLALWTVVPLLAFVLTAKIIYTRYIVFCLICALPAAAALITLAAGQLRRRWQPAGLVALSGVLTLPCLAFGDALLRDPTTAPWFDDRRWITDRFQYVESNFAGYGLRQIVDTLAARAADRPAVVLTRSSTGMPRDGVTAYLLGTPTVHVGLVPENRPVRAYLEEEPTRVFHHANQGASVYYVLTDAPNGEQERRFTALNPTAQLELALPKPGNHSRFLLYRLPWPVIGHDAVLSPPAKFAEGIALTGFNLSSTNAQPGDVLRLTLYWEAAARTRRDLTVFNHLVGTGEMLIGQKDGQPAGGRLPTSTWRRGQFIADTHLLAIRPDAVPGDYELRTGLYHLATLERVPVSVGGVTPTHYVALGKISVR